MDFTFDWNYIAAGAPYITVSDIGLAFNTPAINLLNYPENVILGFDEKNLAIGIKPYDDSTNIKSYAFKSRIKNGWIRIGCKDFVKYLSELSGISFSPAKKFIAKYDSRDNLLYITISQKNIIGGENETND